MKEGKERCNESGYASGRDIRERRGEKWEVVKRKIERLRERESYIYVKRNEGDNRQWEKETHTDCVFVYAR